MGRRHVRDYAVCRSRPGSIAPKPPLFQLPAGFTRRRVGLRKVSHFLDGNIQIRRSFLAPVPPVGTGKDAGPQTSEEGQSLLRRHDLRVEHVEAQGFGACRRTVDMDIGMKNFMQNGPRVPAASIWSGVPPRSAGGTATASPNNVRNGSGTRCSPFTALQARQAYSKLSYASRFSGHALTGTK